MDSVLAPFRIGTHDPVKCRARIQCAAHDEGVMIGDPVHPHLGHIAVLLPDRMEMAQHGLGIPRDVGQQGH